MSKCCATTDAGRHKHDCTCVSWLCVDVEVDRLDTIVTDIFLLLVDADEIGKELETCLVVLVYFSVLSLVLVLMLELVVGT